MADEKKNRREVVFQAVEVSEAEKSVKVKSEAKKTIRFPKAWKGGKVQPGSWYKAQVYDSEYDYNGEQVSSTWVESAVQCDSAGNPIAGTTDSAPAKSPASAPVTASKPTTAYGDDPRGHSILAQVCYKSSCHVVNGMLISGKLDVNLSDERGAQVLINTIDTLAEILAKRTLALAGKIKSGEVK